MALVQITVNGKCSDAEGNPFASKTVYFSPTATFGADTEVVSTQPITATTDVNGDFTVDLYTVDVVGAYVQYAYVLPGGDQGFFDLSDDNDPADLGDLIGLGTQGGVVNTAVFQAMIDAHAAVKASTTVLGHVKVDGSTITIDGSGVISSSGGGGGGGGSVATDAIFDAKGDLVAGTGNNTATKLSVGANDTHLVPDSSVANGLKWITSSALKTLLSLVKGDVGLGNVDNTSDANKPVSTLQAAADALVASDAAAALSSHAGTIGSPSTFGHLKYDGLSIQAASGVISAKPLTPDVEIQRALGLSVVAETVSKWSLTGATNLISGDFWAYPIWMPRGTASTPFSLTGVKFFKFSIGNYVASGLNNKIALYSYSGGTLTRIDAAMTADTNNLWMQGNDSVDSAAFASAYPAVSGLFFVGMLYRNSSQTSAPALRTGTHASSMVTQGFTNSAKWGAKLTGQTDLPASVAMSTMTAFNSIPWLALY